MALIDHIAIRVDDLELAAAWYCDKLAAKVTFKDEKYIRIKVNNTNIALIDKKYYPWPHIAVLVENKEDLPREQGETIEHRDGTMGVYVKDPFGNYLEYIWYSDEAKKVFLS
jgi:extradiol dioxygenase family protein